MTDNPQTTTMPLWLLEMAARGIIIVGTIFHLFTGGQASMAETTFLGGGGGTGGSYPSRMLTGDPWRIDHLECPAGGEECRIVFENGEKIKQSVYRAIIDRKMQ